MTTVTVGYPGQASVVQAIAAPATVAGAQAQMQQQMQVLAAHAHAHTPSLQPPGALLTGDTHSLFTHEAAQLTLTYQGKTYIYEGIKPQKLDAVLALLNDQNRTFVGSTIPTLSANYGMPMPKISSSTAPVASPSKRPNDQERQDKLNRFREKRKERTFNKKIRYTVRKEVAEKMNRNKGQFARSQGGEGGQDGGDGCSPEPAICSHCGLSEKATPMMRRGPNGPRSLCNACGLFWSNKGMMRDLNKAPRGPRYMGAGGAEMRTEPQMSLTLLADTVLGVPGVPQPTHNGAVGVVEDIPSHM